MPTVVNKNIKPAGGGDYTTIAGFLAALPASLVTADEQWNAFLYNDSEYTEGMNFSGTTTDATRYIAITAATGQSFQDNASVRTNGLRYNVSNGVGIRYNNNYASMGSSAQFTRFSRLQIWAEGAGGSILVGINSSIKDCICTSSAAYGLIAHAATLINVFVHTKNNFSNTNGFALGDGHASLPCTLIGCGCVSPSDSLSSGIGFTDKASTIASTLVSCYSFGYATAASGTFGTSKNNATDVASGLPGTANQHSVTYSAITPFTQAAISGTLDFRSIASTALAANGFLDGTNAPNDISLTARAASPTIGPWELASVAPVTRRIIQIQALPISSHQQRNIFE